MSDAVTQNTNGSNNNQANLELANFINNLVGAVYGQSLDEIPEQDQALKAGQAVKLFTDYIHNFVEHKYGKKDAIRIQNTTTEGDMFKKFDELGEDLSGKFMEAYRAFFEMVQSHWKEQK